MAIHLPRAESASPCRGIFRDLIHSEFVRVDSLFVCVICLFKPVVTPASKAVPFIEQLNYGENANSEGLGLPLTKGPHFCPRCITGFSCEDEACTAWLPMSRLASPVSGAKVERRFERPLLLIPARAP